ncbi:MAG: IF-2-associated domain-containing protein, partial [Alphaproteobacteria bacterium]
MSDENDNGRPPAPGGRAPLTLKPRTGAGAVSAGTVKQTFSHGRSKTVVVETKRARPHSGPAGNLAAPSSAEKRVFTAPTAPAAPRPSMPTAADGNLSSEELRARQRAALEHQARQAAEARTRDELARAEASAVAAAKAPPPPPAPTLAEAAPTPVAPPVAPVSVAPVSVAPVAEAPTPVAPPVAAPLPV